MEELKTPDAEAQRLQDTLTELQQSMEEIEKVNIELSAKYTDWPVVMAAIGDYDPSTLTLDSLFQEERRIKLQGKAASEDVVVTYAHRLSDCPEFSRVLIQSIKMLEEAFTTPTQAPPTATPLEPSPEPTVTPRLVDEYEPDDLEPRTIYAYKPQKHNFYPLYDIDRLKFLAKSGRYYRVHTSKLAVGVDTVLTAKVGDQTYQNDDRAIGDFGSELQFHVSTSYDLEAFVDVTNRGKYGPDQSYEISVEEIAPPIPTATPSSTPQPTWTPEPSETDTPQPSPSDTATPMLLTPTFDLRDDYEPDDYAPSPIAIGEEQAHNFCPHGDIDQVTFLGRGGGIYHVYTSRLHPGVDTVLTVRIDGTTTHTNDDVTPGDASSSLTFQVVGLDSKEVVAEIRNKGEYGASRWYRIKVEEIVPTATPSMTPTVSPTHTMTPSSTASATAVPTESPSPSNTASPTCTLTSTPSATPEGAEAHLLKLPGLASFQHVLFTAPSSEGTVHKAGRQALPNSGQGSVEFIIILELGEGQ
ncbi:MAG: hypothetical protein U9R48_06965 [Chloroflexota bacterium]|nr:hypothetical protein [Chloroflexota bacterium]